MELEFWLKRWQQQKIGFHQEDINTHLQAFWSKMGLQPGATIFVPLSGKSRDMLWLLGQGYNIVGVEVSPTAVRDFFAENDLTPTISQRGLYEYWQIAGLSMLCGDFFELTVEDLKVCDGVYDRAALIALPPEMRKIYVRHLNAIMPSVSRTLLITLEYDQAEMEGPPFCVSEDEVYALYSADYEIEQLFAADVLTESPAFREKGLNRLGEKVYKLSPRKLV